MSAQSGQLLYGTVVALEVDGGGDSVAWGVLLRGPSGSGKSDLALRLIHEGARLVADDQVYLTRDDARGSTGQKALVYASAPPAIAGMLEVRGVGLVGVPAIKRAPIALIIDLVKRQDVPRLPDARTGTILGQELPLLALCPFEASAAAKVKVALACLLG